MKRILIAYAIVLLVFPLLDFSWFALTFAPLYQADLGGLVSANPNLAPAVAYYVLYAAGVVAFVVAPSLDRGWRRTALAGAGFGLVAYGVYDLTNLATLHGFSLKIALLDMAWGAAATAAVASAARLGVLVSSSRPASASA
ncbi:MAG TPA: DUF2177 family protein [Caulobacteraceae bacterium]|nr:DUF2177 family protein [Caulobacteraceae bacterium]